MMFMFLFFGVPLPSCKEYGRLKKAHIHVWVQESNEVLAEKKAREYIKSFEWNPEGVQDAFQIPHGLIPPLGAAEEQLFHRALKYGIAADFVASPVQEGNPDDPVWMRPMNEKGSFEP